MKRMALSFAGLLCTTVLIAAPAPKDTPDSQKESGVGEPVEPAIDPVRIEKNAILEVRDKANRAKSANHLKQFGLAMHNYHDVHGRFPADVVDGDGTPILSWRVLILPYLEQENVYRQFKLDEPWNGPNNSKLIEQMPKIFESPRVTSKKKGYTAYQGFSGAQALFRPGKGGLQMTNITDGTSNTIMMIETSTAVPWTKPADMPFDPKKDLPDIGKAYGQKPYALMCDGSVRLLDLKKLPAETIKHAIQPDDGNLVDLGDEK
jgi:Protein of unknown function (DUF1559)